MTTTITERNAEQEALIVAQIAASLLSNHMAGRTPVDIDRAISLAREILAASRQALKDPSHVR